MKVTVVRVRVPTEDREAVVKSIQRVLEPTRVESGCLGMQCGCDIEDENALVIIERWATQEDLEQHIRSDQYRVILSVLESSSEDPEVQFHEVSGTAGMEVIFETRGQARNM